MAHVRITPVLTDEIRKRFTKTEANKIIDLLYTLEENPKRGKILTNVSGIVVKELKHKKWRFYCITDGRILTFGTEDELATLLIKFVKMSDKKDQQKTIDEIKNALEAFGFDLK